jgi:hypothetical protein
MKILEFKRSGIGIIAEFRGIPNGFPNQGSEDHELMQLKTVLESSPHVWMPPYGHLTVYSSSRVTLVHLAANAIPLGLQVAGQEVPQELIRLGDCLVVLLLGFLEHLLDLLDLQPASLHVIIRRDNFFWTQQPSGDP